MSLRSALAGLSAVLLLAVAAGSADAGSAAFTPGAAGIGDEYFPKDGNGGYDVTRYDLELAYDPATDVLDGTATITLRARHGLSRFNFDFDGLTVHAVTVDGETAPRRRSGGELTIVPQHGIPAGEVATVVVDYSGVPQALPPADDGGGFLPTDDGALVVGQPHVAATWFPVNDHPRDKARFHFAITVPDPLEVVANGHLVSHDSADGRTTWVWDAPAPMAPYLATIDVGEYDLHEYHADAGRPGGVDLVDAVDVDLSIPVTPHTGTRYAISQRADNSYKRLSRTLSVPAEGATVDFWIHRDTELRYDHVIVEARTAGQNDWTTLRDANGHTTARPGAACPYWFGIHPFLRHYEAAASTGGCRAVGSTGVWRSATGAGAGWEEWSVDLGDFAGSDAQIAISVVSDDIVQGGGVYIDDIVTSTGEGSTSFEADGDELDGWTVPGPPATSPGNANDWITGTVDDAPPTTGEVVADAFARQPEILDFLASRFGPYPFADSGGIVDDLTGVGFALENQTRPVYAPEFFDDPVGAASVVVHELAHQWYGDRVALDRWRHIWLNEGFATYAEWMWSAHEGGATPQQIFAELSRIPASDPFWHLEIGDPGPALLFDGAVYDRGAMTLQALRNRVGNADFFTILQRWGQGAPGRRTTTHNFLVLAERVSGRQLDALFERWLFTAAKPAGLSNRAAGESELRSERAAAERIGRP